MPLLSLAHALRKSSKDCRIVYIGLKGEGLANDLKARFSVFDEVYSVPAGKFRRYHGESLLSQMADLKTLAFNVRDFFRLLAGIGYARRLLKRLKPDVVFSKGGFVAVPVGLAASTLKIPIVTHDSDTVPGLANRIVGRFARLHTTGMQGGSYSYPKETVHYVGIPIDERIKPVTKQAQQNYKKQLGLPADALVLLIGGAGLGARDVNNKLLTIAPKLMERFGNLHILHIAGQKHAEQLTVAYKEGLPRDIGRIEVVGFTPEFYKYSGAADLVITRAGATTIAELAAQRKAVILIPAPHLTGGHQLKNAQELEKQQAASVVANEAAPEELYKVIETTLDDEHRRQQLADKLGATAKADAADKLAGLLLQAAERK